jgi:hypothetical protein
MNVLWIPIFSMRSYETGEYSALKDGNFQLTMSRVLASNFDRVFVAVPEDTSDLDELAERFKDHPHVYFTQMKYGANAVATRDFFWIANTELLKSLEVNVDVVISDVTGYTGLKPVVYNFNITKLPELNRPYIDRFFEADLKSIEQSLFTTVINPRQREYILEVRPDLLDRVIVNTKCAHTDLLPKFPKTKPPEKLIFWPFRISDKAYQWEQFLAAFEEQGLHEDGYVILCTDPNDTLECDKPFVMKKKLTKEQYYRILASQPIVVMLDDIDTVLHPGTIEFFHYACPVITYSSNLIMNLNTIPDLRWLRKELEDLEYNRVDVSPFVYAAGEIDSLYNKDFVNVTSN